jgi:uncharacterized protein
MAEPGQSRSAPAAFNVMTKPRGSICNLECKYCYYLSKEKLYPNGSFLMSDELLEIYTRQYIEAQNYPEVNFAWQGGEPTLMGLDFFRKAVALQQKYRRPGMRIQNSLQTNAVGLDDAWAQFFRQHDFLIGVSLDGPEELHDAYRVDKGGHPTQRRVLQGIRTLQRNRVDFNILCCVHAANGEHPLQVYRYLRDEVGAQFIQFIPIVERLNGGGKPASGQVTRRSIQGRVYGQFLSAVFDEWVRRDVGCVFVQLFDVCLGVWLGRPANLCVFDETCGLGLALEHNGDVYACDHYVEPRYRLGNIRETDLSALVACKEQVKFGLAKRERLPRECRKCDVRFICNGGCPKNRLQRTPQGEPAPNYLCEGYQTFFRHINEPMKLMAMLIRLERAPAEVMDILSRRAVGDVR